jgi:hypothetical protein
LSAGWCAREIGVRRGEGFFPLKARVLPGPPDEAGFLQPLSWRNFSQGPLFSLDKPGHKYSNIPNAYNAQYAHNALAEPGISPGFQGIDGSLQTWEAQVTGGNEMIVVHILTLAKEIGVHRNTIRNWVKSGRINARPGPGKGLIFTPENFEALCQEFQLHPENFQVRELSRQIDSPVIPGKHPAATREEQVSDKIIGSVMVVGGGIAGIQASLDLADQGYYVYLVEQSAGIGGKMSQLDKTYPTNDCAM